MAKKKAGISEEVREAINKAARAGAYEAYKNTAGAYVNYFKAMETLLYNYKKLAALAADEEGYCEVEYHAGRKTFAAGSKSTGYYEQKTEADIIAEMQEEKRRQYRETKYGFERLERAITFTATARNSPWFVCTTSARTTKASRARMESHTRGRN